MINKSHMLSAICGLEKALGTRDCPARVLYDYAQQHFIDGKLPVVFLQTVTTRDGRTLNGCLRYYILPIQMSIEQFYERQLHAADLALERQRAEQRMAALKRKECASGC